MILFPPTPLDPRIAAIGAGLAEAPLRHLGRDRHGVDCVGTVALVYAGLGIDVQAPLNYPMRWFESQPRRMIDHVEGVLGWRRCNTAAPGDLLIFAQRTIEGDHPGVYAGGGMVLHAVRSGVRLTKLEDRVGPIRWADILRIAYRPGARSCRHKPESGSDLAPSSGR